METRDERLDANPGFLTRSIFLTLALILAGCGLSGTDRGGNVTDLAPSYRVVIVRHANRSDGSQDSALSASGLERAFELAQILKTSAIERVHSTDWIRTRDTAQPTATALGLDIERYDGGQLLALSKTVKSSGGSQLIVGHSNTVNESVQLLGGEPGSEIHHDEYDRIYLVSRGCNGDVETRQLRYPQDATRIASTLSGALPDCASYGTNN